VCDTTTLPRLGAGRDNAYCYLPCRYWYKGHRDASVLDVQARGGDVRTAPWDLAGQWLLTVLCLIGQRCWCLASQRIKSCEISAPAFCCIEARFR
jgi:hypothetical protein